MTTAARIRHAWQASNGRSKVCGTCDLEAVARVRDSAGNWHSVWAKSGRRFISSRTPECGEVLPAPAAPGRLAALAREADHAAGYAFRAGDLGRAAQLIADARILDPSQGDLWRQREERIREAHQREEAQRPASFAGEINRRLAAAGIRPDDPGIKLWVNHNRAVGVRFEEAGQ